MRMDPECTVVKEEGSYSDPGRARTERKAKRTEQEWRRVEETECGAKRNEGRKERKVEMERGNKN